MQKLKNNMSKYNDKSTPRAKKTEEAENKEDRYIKDPFDQELCIRLAGVASACYKSSKSIVHDLRALGMNYHEYELISKDNAQAYVIWNNEEVIVAWRGTEPSEYKDVLADLKFRKVSGLDGRVHRGFKGYVDKIYDQVLAKVKEITAKKWYKVYVTGHSLGGASALICTNRFEEHFFVQACYTYGSPRPGGWKYSQSFKTKVFRVRNNNDVVTKVPPTWFGYKHVGQLCYIDRHGTLRTGKVKWYVIWRNWIKGQFERIGDGLRDHSITEYYNLLKNAERIDKR